MTKKNNSGFLLAESLIVSTFVLTILIFLYIQFNNLMINHKSSYIYNSVDSIYNLGSMADFLVDNDRNKEMPSGSYYITIYQNGSCQNVAAENKTACETLAASMNLDTLILTTSDITSFKNNVNSTSLSQDLKDFVSKMDTSKVKEKNRLIGKFKNGNFGTIIYNKTKNGYVPTSILNPILNGNLNVTTTPATQQKGEKVTINVPTVAGYTYLGATIKTSDGNTYAELNKDTKEFVMPEDDVTIHPTYKYNDKVIYASGGVRDTTFSMNLTHANKMNFGYYNNSFYYYNAPDTKGYRAQAVSDKSYDVSKYCQLVVKTGGNRWGTPTSGAHRDVYFGLIRNKNQWLVHPTSTSQNAKSPDYTKGYSMTIKDGYNSGDQVLTLNPAQSANNKYYVAMHYLSIGANSSLNWEKIEFKGCTYTS